MHLPGKFKVGLMSFISRLESVLLNPLAVVFAAYAVLNRLSFPAVGRYPLGKIWVLGFFPCLFVSGVLGVSANSQIDPTIVERVPILVVGKHSIGDLNAHKAEDNSVGAEHMRHSIPAQLNHAVAGCSFGLVSVDLNIGSSSGTPIIELLPCSIPNEVRSRALFPDQRSLFFIVREALLQELPRGETFRQIHNQVFGYGFRRIRELRTLGAPSLYTLTAASQ